MRFLLDHDVPADIERILISRGHSVVTVRDVMPTTASDAEAYRTKHKLTFVSSISDPLLSFSATHLSFDPVRRLLACGAMYGRRIRIVSVDSPHDIVRELHSDESPVLGNVGIWSVERVEFAGGRFLVAQYYLETKAFFDKKITEIYDVTNWTCVWKDKDIDAATISPDGKKVAYVRNIHFMEIVSW